MKSIAIVVRRVPARRSMKLPHIEYVEANQYFPKISVPDRRDKSYLVDMIRMAVTGEVVFQKDDRRNFVGTWRDGIVVSPEYSHKYFAVPIFTAGLVTSLFKISLSLVGESNAHTK